MSYTPPAGNAADLQFAGVYVPYPGDRADLTFEELTSGVTRAQGIRSTVFSTPGLAYIAVGLHGTTFSIPSIHLGTAGIYSTAFGTPRFGVDVQHTSSAPATTFGTAAIQPHVMPIYNTTFGTPNSPYLQTGTATGIPTLQLGPNPRVVTVELVFPTAPSTRFSTAYTAFAQTAVTAGALHTKFGSPFYGAPTDVVTNLSCRARGWLVTAFGAPRAPHAVSATASWIDSTRWGWPRSYTAGPLARLGTPHASMLQAATGWVGTAFGAPQIPHTASSFISTGIGTPSATGAHIVAPRTLRTRFGNPASFIAGHKAFGFTLTRFAQPQATNRINRLTSGWNTTAHGTPVAVQTHRATHIAPPNALGTPLLRRNALC